MSLVLATIACGVPPRTPTLLKDQRAMCRAAFSAAVLYGSSFPLREPVMLDADATCRNALPDVEYAMLRHGLLADQLSATTTLRVRPDGTTLAIRVDDAFSLCHPPNYPLAGEGNGICDILPEMCPKVVPVVVHGPLPVDTSCSRAAEGRCFEIRVTASDYHPIMTGDTEITLTCQRGAWRVQGGNGLVPVWR